jgi:hypothetical protein
MEAERREGRPEVEASTTPTEAMMRRVRAWWADGYRLDCIVFIAGFVLAAAWVAAVVTA